VGQSERSRTESDELRLNKRARRRRRVHVWKRAGVRDCDSTNKTEENGGHGGWRGRVSKIFSNQREQREMRERQGEDERE